MIRVKVELVPGGDESKARLMAVGTIANDGTGDRQRGNYTVALSRRHPKTHVVWRRGHVADFPRRELGPWDLLFRALMVTVGMRYRPFSEPGR